jgi:UDP-glucose 4-epimerase
LIRDNPSEKTILVTGGAGFIGSHLVDRLVNAGYAVRIIDNLSTGRLENIACHLNSGAVKFVKGDIRDLSLLRSSLQGVYAVAHLAALTSVPQSVENPESTFEVNAEATAEITKLSENAGVKRFIFASSCAVYGDAKDLPVNENTAPNPLSPYAQSKLIAEHYCLERTSLQSTVLRLFNVYGPRQGISEYSSVITRFAESIRRKEPLTIYGDGSQTRDFVYVSDIVNSLFTVIESKIADEVFNIGIGQPTSIDKLAKTMLTLTRSDLPINYGLPRVGDIKNSYADISKAKMLLDFAPSFTLREGLTAFLMPQGSGVCLTKAINR